MSDFQFTADDVRIEAFGRNMVEVTVSGASESDLLSQMDVSDAVSHFSKVDLIGAMGSTTVLDIIGAEECKSYFGLTEEE